MNTAELLQDGRNTASVEAIFPPGRPKEKTAPSGGSVLHVVKSVGATWPA
jgi:hypothetical protein